MCGMYQLAKDLAKEFDGDILTKKDNPLLNDITFTHYDKVISLLYPMHNIAKKMKKAGAYWICYDQKIPPTTKLYFPNFWRRQYMKVFTWLNNRSMKGADEYWDVTEREQKPRWTEKIKLERELIELTIFDLEPNKKYAIYLGRTTDYKNFDWLHKTMEELEIPLIHPKNLTDDEIYILLSNAEMLVTASLWEGYGRGVSEAENLGIPAISYDIGAQKRNTTKGICVPLGDEESFKKAVLKVWNEN